jgi:ParB family chromosome partitioning protein
MAKPRIKSSGNKVGRQQLNQGLDKLFGGNIDKAIEEDPEKVARELSNTVANIPIDQIESNPDQPRKEFDEEALQELAQSIQTYGLIQPITVRRLSAKKYQIISGERRWRASKLAGEEEIPAYIRLAKDGQPINDQQLMEMALVENIQRENLTPLEIANTYQRLLDKDEFNLTHEELAGRVGKKRTTITNYLRLLKLSPMVMRALQEERITRGHAVAIAGVNISEQHDILRVVEARRLSVRATEELAKEYREGAHKQNKGAKPKKKGAELPPAFEGLLEDLRAIAGAKNEVQINLKKGEEGQVLLPFKSYDQLADWIEKLKG